MALFSHKSQMDHTCKLCSKYIDSSRIIITLFSHKWQMDHHTYKLYLIAYYPCYMINLASQFNFNLVYFYLIDKST